MNLRPIAKKVIFTIFNNPYSRRIYLKDIKARSSLALTEIKGLSKNIPLFTPYSDEIHKPNDFYGHATAIKKYLGLKNTYPLKFSIEHGLIVIDQISGIEQESPFLALATLGQRRKKLFLEKFKKFYSIGPYIHYATHYLNTKEIKKEKIRLGKNLLVFPSHSSAEVITKFNIKTFCEHIKKIAKGYDSVRVCLYWRDVLLGLQNLYQEYGFECVTAGHVLDPFFLPRLKSIIEVSSFTLSNDVGTHISYCLYLKKPHAIIDNHLNYSGRKSEVILTNQILKEKDYKDFVKAFSKMDNNITSKQKGLINDYCGFSEIKTKKQLMNIIQESEKLYKQSNS